MRKIRFAAIAFSSFMIAIASSLINPGTFFHRTLSFILCSVLGLTSNLCYVNLARNSGERAVAAFPPQEQTEKTNPILDFSPYFQSTRPEFDGADIPVKPETSSPPSNSGPPQPSPSTPINTPNPNNPNPEPEQLTPGGSTSNVPCNPTLLTASAEPAKEVIVQGVPTSFKELVARINSEESSELFPTVARRLENGNVGVTVPIHPTKGVVGGKAQLSISSGNTTCSVLSFKIDPLTPAPGTTQRMFAKQQEFADQMYKAFGVSRAELLGDPKTLPEEVLPLATVQYLLDHPRNPNSLKAILAGTAPILNGQKPDISILDGIVANSEMIDKLDALLKRVSELLTVSSDSLNENSSVAFTALKAFTVKDIFRKEHSQKNTQLKQASRVKNLLDTKDPDKLARYCQLYDYGAIKDDPLYQSVTFIAGLITTVISLAPGVGSAVSLGASIGMFAVNMVLKAMKAWMPFYVTNFTFNIDKPSLDLADNRTGRWNNVIIQTRSEGGSVDISDLIDLLMIAVGVKGQIRSAAELSKIARLQNQVDETARILDDAKETYFRAFQAKNGVQRTGLTSAAQLDAELASAQRNMERASDQWNEARRALKAEKLEQDSALKKIETVLDKIDSILNGTVSYIGDKATQNSIPIQPIYYSQVTLYSEQNPSMKYISTQVQRSAVSLAEQNVYQSVNKGNSDLVIAPKFGSIKGACETWAPDPDIKKTGIVEEIKTIVVNDKDDNSTPPQQLGQLTKGTSYGDPHMITFDRFKYSFQTVGEFTLVKSTDENFEVQVRQGAMSNSVSMNTAVAMKIGNSRITLYAKNLPDSDTSTPLRVDGKPTKLDNETLELPGGGLIQGNSSNYLITAPTGEQVGVRIGNQRMDITPYISAQSGQYIGLLGNANGDPADDLQTRAGKVIPTKENSTYGQLSEALSNVLPVPAPLTQAEKIFFDIVYKEFGDSWRITQAESLFDYPPGKDTGTYTNRSFPNSYLSLNSLLPPQIRQAEEICREAGVESELMDGCIFDVANTGDASFAESAANALTDIIKDRVEQEIRDRIPLPGGINIPGLPF